MPTKLVLPTEKFINLFFVGYSNMEEEENLLIDNLRKFLKSAEIVYETNDFTSSTILYFKSLFAVFDLLILRKYGKTPKDHSERFRILEKDFPELYIILDSLYPIYRTTYTLSINKNTTDKIKENVEKIIREQKIF